MQADHLTLLTDDELMTMIVQGDIETPLAEMQRRYGLRLVRLIRGVVDDDWLAQDLAQEVMVKVFTKSHLYRIGTSFQAWLFGIARNHARSALRRRRLTPRPLSSLRDGGSIVDICDQVAEAVDPGCVAEEGEVLGAFRDAVEGLPDMYREVFERCVIGGQTYRDAADELGIPAGTVAIRISRARKRLFKELECHVPEMADLPPCVR